MYNAAIRMEEIERPVVTPLTLITAEMFEEFVLPYCKAEQKTIRGCGPNTMLHICGNTTANLPAMILCGSSSISVE